MYEAGPSSADNVLSESDNSEIENQVPTSDAATDTAKAAVRKTKKNLF